jgi:hypothetical protein
MKTKFIATLLLVTTLFSCKNESNNDKSSVDNNQTEVSKNFKVTLNVIVKKDDNFQVYYTEKSSNDFNEKESVWVEIKGSENPQDVVFNIPEEVVPTMFRLDFGVNDKQEDIKLNGVNIEYLGKSFKSEIPLLANFFRPEASTQIDFNTGIIKAIVKDGKRQEPALYPHEAVLQQEINKLIK